MNGKTRAKPRWIIFSLQPQSKPTGSQAHAEQPPPRGRWKGGSPPEGRPPGAHTPTQGPRKRPPTRPTGRAARRAAGGGARPHGPEGGWGRDPCLPPPPPTSRSRGRPGAARSGPENRSAPQKRGAPPPAGLPRHRGTVGAPSGPARRLRPTERPDGAQSAPPPPSSGDEAFRGGGSQPPRPRGAVLATETAHRPYRARRGEPRGKRRPRPRPCQRRRRVGETRGVRAGGKKQAEGVGARARSLARSVAAAKGVRRRRRKRMRRSAAPGWRLCPRPARGWGGSGSEASPSSSSSSSFSSRTALPMLALCAGAARR